MNPRQKRFNRKYLPIADAIARLDIGQEDREAVATAVADALDGAAKAARSSNEREESAGWGRDLFWLLAVDPLVPCAGPHGEGCPHGREIKIPMHNSAMPDGRSFAWRHMRPPVQCISCGAEAWREEQAS